MLLFPRERCGNSCMHDGYICDMMEFNGSWDEEAVMKSLVEAFVAVLDPNAPAPKYSLMIFTLFNNNIVISTLLLYRIRIMKACGGQLKIPHVPAGHKWTAPTIKAICNNGDLYIQATSPLRRLGVEQTEQSDSDI